MSGAHYHLVGVAGVGMSPLAQTAVWRGFEVSGSDRSLDRSDDLAVLHVLQRAGVRLVKQDGSGIRADTAGVVVSTAIEKDNPDLVEAGQRGIPVLHRSQFLQTMVADSPCVAVTGTSGKSTVTGMIGWILSECGKDPWVVNGAPVLSWMGELTLGSARKGGRELWVIEADESDRTLLNYSPEWGVITNASKDHFDMEETLDLFRRFSGRVKRGVISTLDLPEWFRNFVPEVRAEGSRFSYGGRKYRTQLPGRHNAENALVAVVACETMGCRPDDIARALAGFRGIHRRLETVGVARGITVMDDFGHNPAKIRAALETVKPHYKRLIVVWRPHGYRPLATMMEDLTEVFSEVLNGEDQLWVLPVYDAGGTADRSISSAMLVKNVADRGVKADYATDVEAVPERMAHCAKAGDVVLIMGARDPGLPKLARDVMGRVC